MSGRPAHDVGQFGRRGRELRAAPCHVSIGTDQHEWVPVEPGDLSVAARHGPQRDLAVGERAVEPIEPVGLREPEQGVPATEQVKWNTKLQKRRGV